MPAASIESTVSVDLRETALLGLRERGQSKSDTPRATPAEHTIDGSDPNTGI